MASDLSEHRASVVADKGALIVRASAAGRCRRELWYSYRETEQAPVSNRVQTMWDAGWALEPVVIASMERDGWETQKPSFAESILRVTAARIELDDGRIIKLVFTCHPDAYVKYEDQWIVADVKTRNSGAFAFQMTMGAELSHPGDVMQIAIYTLAAFGEWRPAMLVPFNMDDRWWDTDPIPGDRIETAYRRGIDRLKPFVLHLFSDRADEPPDRDYEADSFQCRGCAFRNTCRPGGSPLDLDLEFEPPSRAEARIAVSEYERAEAVLASLKADSEPWEGRKKAAQESLRLYMEERVAAGLPTEDYFESTVEGAKPRKVKLQGGRRTKVDMKKLKLLLSPDVRAEVVEIVPNKKYVRVY